MFTARVITVSDRSARGERPDEGGPLVRAILNEAGYAAEDVVIVPDEKEDIKRAIIDAATDDVALIVTTGGTGFSPRDVTPEATAEVCDRMAPGIPEAMRAASMAITPRGMLSRGTAGLIGRSMVINVPGSPKAAKENLEAVLGAVEHGLVMLRGNEPANCAEIKD